MGKSEEKSDGAARVSQQHPLRSCACYPVCEAAVGKSEDKSDGTAGVSQQYPLRSCACYTVCEAAVEKSEEKSDGTAGVSQQYPLRSCACYTVCEAAVEKSEEMNVWACHRWLEDMIRLHSTKYQGYIFEISTGSGQTRLYARAVSAVNSKG